MYCAFCNKQALIKLIGNQTNGSVIMEGIEVMVCEDHAKELLNRSSDRSGGVLSVEKGLFNVIKEIINSN